MNFTAADDDGEFASGVDFTEYSVDGGVWQQGDSVEVTEDGEHTVRYRSTRQRRQPRGRQGGRRSRSTSRTWSSRTCSRAAPRGPRTRSTIPYGETVTWHWEEGSGQPHNVGLIAPAPTEHRSEGGSQLISRPSMPPDSDPVSYTFRKQGTWEFVCTLHSSFNQTTHEWTGMVGTVDVEANTDPDTDAPGTTRCARPGAAGPAAGPTPARSRSR